MNYAVLSEKASTITTTTTIICPKTSGRATCWRWVFRAGWRPVRRRLGVMLIALGLNRIALGLGLIVAFSFGLAAVLIAIGVLLVRSRSRLHQLGKPGSAWQRLLPLISAVVVTLLGAGIVLKGLMPTWHESHGRRVQCRCAGI